MRNPGFQLAFSPLEIIIITGAVPVIAMPARMNYANGTRGTQAVSDTAGISMVMSKYIEHDQHVPPDTLAVASPGGDPDRGSGPRVFTNSLTVTGTGSSHEGTKIKLIHSNLDPCRVGINGPSRLPLTSDDSQDAVVRARDVEYIGLAGNFEP